jgi:hypothetical protein
MWLFQIGRYWRQLSFFRIPLKNARQAPLVGEVESEKVQRLVGDAARQLQAGRSDSAARLCASARPLAKGARCTAALREAWDCWGNETAAPLGAAS